MMYNKGQFHPWVSENFGTVLICILTLPVLSVGGIYTANLGDMYAGLGRLSEDMSFANYTTTIGMVIAFSFVFPIKKLLHPKVIILAVLIFLALLSLAIAQLEDPVLIGICSFWIGFLKIIGMVELITPLMILIAPTGDRGVFYSVFYPISIGVGQLAAYYTAKLAYEYNWHYSYVVMAGVLLGCGLLVVIFMHNKRAGKREWVKDIDWISIGLMTTILLLINFILVYAKAIGWTASNLFTSCCGLLIVLIVVFIYRQVGQHNQFLLLHVFKKRNVLTAFLLIGLMGMFLATATMQSAFTGLMKYDSQTNALLNLFMVPTAFLAGFVAYWCFKKQIAIRWLFLMAFLSFQVYTVAMYFLIAPVIDIRYLFIPILFKGFGMCMAYVAGGYYFANKLTMGELMATLPLLIAVRTFISVAFFGSLFSWALYHLQWDNMQVLSGSMDAMNSYGMERGSGLQLFSSVQIQATLMAIKQVFGFVALAGMLVLVYILLHPFQRMHRRKLVIALKRFKGESYWGYKRKEDETVEGATAIAASTVI
jgi:DHA2 family multidrug resistance protein